jgi:YebC/PmpR family DNA-binding regulatory protein
MAGHSKWASIKHKKKAVDAKRGAHFTKLTRAITVAAREGGGDPDGNPSLALAIQKARDASMPKDNIERAIAKGTGADSDADAYEAVVYEGYGPGGVAILVEALTDNRNRTGSEVRHAFTSHGGSLGEPGSPRLPSCLVKASRTSAVVRLRLSVSASTRIAAPPGP